MAAEAPEELPKVAFLGREAVRFIRENRSNPCVLFVSFLEPHPFYTSPLAHLYPPDEIPVGPSFMKRPVENVSRFHSERPEYYLGLERLVLNLDSDVKVEDFELRTEAGWGGALPPTTTATPP